VHLASRRQADELVVSVADTGIGIRAEDQERIFAAFTQVDGSYARNYQGTGLGLTLVKRFVEIHGGSISVSSRIGEGSVFTFRIPLSPQAGGNGETLAPGPPGQDTTEPTMEAAGRLILVVEDNPGNMKLTREILRARGFRVLEASSGEEALDTVRFIRPDLILIDIQLPGLDGLSVTRRLKADPSTCDIPVVALTAHAMQGDEDAAMEAGCVAYIPKPIDAAAFPRRVIVALSRTSPAPIKVKESA